MGNGDVELIRGIDQAISDKPLASETIQVFDEAYRDFASNRSDREEMETRIKEMAQLLTVSQKNLEEVQNQGWFKRSWHSVTGHNRKLEKVNNANLLKVQKGALYFLQLVAESDRQMMHTVVFALRRLEDVQIESIKLKGYLTQAVRKYNRRLAEIEDTLGDHEGRIRTLHYQARYGFSAVLSLCASILCLLLLSANLRWWFSGLGLVIAGAFAWMAFQPHAVDDVDQRPSSPKRSSIAEHNCALRPQLEELIREFFKCCFDGFIYPPFQSFGATSEKLDEIYGRLVQAQDAQSWIPEVKAIASIAPTDYGDLEKAMVESSGRFVSCYNELVHEIASESLPDVPGMDVLAGIDASFQRQLANNLCCAVAPYAAEFSELRAIHQRLASGVDKFAKIGSESIVKAGGKAVLEGLTWGIYNRASQDEEFMTAYGDDVRRFGEKWDNLRNILANSVFDLHHGAYEKASENLVQKMRVLWDGFDDKHASLQPILDQFREAITDARKEQ